MGQPSGLNRPLSSAEYIGGRRRTWGTETSQYLEEQTSTETPRVVASESGLGQWSAVKNRNVLEGMAIVGESPVRVDSS